nr:MAG TPA: hypothetical protein [Caudoviricetes sp.]
MKHWSRSTKPAALSPQYYARYSRSARHWSRAHTQRSQH